MAIFNSYVKLPEGIFHFIYGMSSCDNPNPIDELHHFSRWAHCTTNQYLLSGMSHQVKCITIRVSGVLLCIYSREALDQIYPLQIQVHNFQGKPFTAIGCLLVNTILSYL